jgi:predicted RNase H-like HicB family nuclease
MYKIVNYTEKNSPEKPNSTFCGCVSTSYAELVSLSDCQARPNLSVEEKQVEQHFLDTHYCQADGRYVVFLPTKPSISQLGDSKQMALRRFEHLSASCLVIWNSSNNIQVSSKNIQSAWPYGSIRFTVIIVSS